MLYVCPCVGSERRRGRNQATKSRLGEQQNLQADTSAGRDNGPGDVEWLMGQDGEIGGSSEISARAGASGRRVQPRRQPRRCSPIRRSGLTRHKEGGRGRSGQPPLCVLTCLGIVDPTRWAGACTGPDGGRCLCAGKACSATARLHNTDEAMMPGWSHKERRDGLATVDRCCKMRWLARSDSSLQALAVVRLISPCMSLP